jgi:hypothetical protein
MAMGGETSVSRAIEYDLNRESLSSNVPAWHRFRFRCTEYADRFRDLNAGQLWNAKAYAAAKAQRSRSNMIQLLVLLAALGVLALWAYVNR